MPRDSETYLGVTIAPDFSSLEREDGKLIAFTRSETRVLGLLAQYPGRLLTRDQILDALSKPGSAKSDRNIDFLISQLRKKLGDDVRNPRFIATRYGEGYVWVGKAQDTNGSLFGAHLVVGPLHGLDNLGPRQKEAEDFVAALAQGFRRALPAERRVVVGPNFPPANVKDEGLPEQMAELSFFNDASTINCVVALKEFRTGRVLAARRSALPATDDTAHKPGDAALELARGLLDEAWFVKTTATDVRVPLPVAMFTSTAGPRVAKASALDSDRRLSEIGESDANQTVAALAAAETRLKNLRKTLPDNPVVKLMLAIAIHGKYVAAGHELFLDAAHDCAADRAEMERLALEALPYVQSQPEYAVMAAKILHFVDRSYAGLARQLAEDAYRSSVALAATLATVGQLRAFAGEIEASLDCIDQALSLVEPGTHEQYYVLIIKALALMSAADYDRLQELKQTLYPGSPSLRLFLEPILNDPRNPSFGSKTATLALTRARATALLRHLNYTFARQFLSHEAGGNVLAGALALVVPRFGPSVVPDEIAEAFPRLIPRD